MPLRVLLVEPGYPNRYPPLGLMKISAYHKLRGDLVRFHKGAPKASLVQGPFDRIYMSTLFTFNWDVILKTAQACLKYVPASKLYIGGAAATLLADELHQATGAVIIQGLLDKPGALGYNDGLVIDHLPPDYGILSQTTHTYSLDDAYIGYTTRGCPNRCRFCAVHRIEPDYVDYVPLIPQIRSADMAHGERQNLVLLDNNILASRQTEKILKEIADAGFPRGARRNNRKRIVDFNQGLDSRLITQRNARLLSHICLAPVRLAFDSDTQRKPYRDAVRVMAENGFTSFTTYLMYNFLESPSSFYERMRLNPILSSELSIRITGFPMRFIPLEAKGRGYVSPKWTWRLLRGVQCVIHATHGLVSPNPVFFDAAFGSTPEEFLEILSMPDRYIIYRRYHVDLAREWRKEYRALGSDGRLELHAVLESMHESRTTAPDLFTAKKVARILEHYYPGGKMPPKVVSG
jgi:hypothetical protein